MSVKLARELVEEEGEDSDVKSVFLEKVCLE